MVHAELIGPPGSGKSTLLRHLCRRRPDVYCGVALSHVHVNRLFFNSPAAGNLANMFLDRPTQFLWDYRYRPKFSRAFFAEHPPVLTALSRALQSSEYETSTILKRIQWSAANHQFSTHTAECHESVVVDEGLCQGGIVIGARSSTGTVPESYLESLPRPAGVIAVDAPSDVCLERQAERDRVISHAGGEVSASEVVRRSRNSTETILENMSSTGVETLRLSGSDDIQKNVDRISNFLSTLD